MIEANDAAVQFIRHWLQPLTLASVLALAKREDPVAPIVARSPVDRDDSQSSSGVSSKWQFKQNVTPNIRDKISWQVDKSAWKVKAKKTIKSEKCQVLFEVDASLTGRDFLTMKAGQYRLAIKEWNAKDHTTRARIKEPLLSPDGEISMQWSMPDQTESSPTPQEMVVAGGTPTSPESSSMLERMQDVEY